MMRLILKRKRSPKGGQEGFVILESLIAVAIVGIFMAGVTLIMWGAIRANVLARKISEATAYGVDVIERISTMPLATVQAGGLDEPDVEKVDMLGNPYIEYRFDIWTNPDADYPNTVDVEVFVYWLDPKSRFVHPDTGMRVSGVTLRDIKT